jgi:hypothetical protein
MRKTWLVRVNTLILALLVAGGGSGLPVADALFHHLQDGTPRGTHLTDGEAPASHAERCSLGVPLPAMATAGAVAELPCTAALPFAPLASSTSDSDPSTVVPAAARPRAPPLRIG